MERTTARKRVAERANPWLRSGSGVLREQPAVFKGIPSVLFNTIRNSGSVYPIPDSL